MNTNIQLPPDENTQEDSNLGAELWEKEWLPADQDKKNAAVVKSYRRQATLMRQLGEALTKIEEQKREIAFHESIFSTVFEALNKAGIARIGPPTGSGTRPYYSIRKRLGMLVTEVQTLRAIKNQVEDELVTNWIPVEGDDYRKALHKLVCWNIQIALDPAVSRDAFRNQEEIRVLHRALELAVKFSNRGADKKSFFMKRAIEQLDLEDATEHTKMEIPF
jgi:hypothetical protein